MPAQPFIGQNQAGEVKTEWPTPNPVDEIMVALLESKVEDYMPLLMGFPPPQGSHPEQLLCQQIPVDWSHVQRTYAKDRQLQQTYNYSISYDEEGNAFPTFTRDYIVRRYGYVPLTKGSLLRGLMSTAVNAGGTGYDQETVTVVLTGGTGSGGAVSAVVSGGVIVHLAITAEGDYTIAPTLTISGGAGTGAMGTCAVQPGSTVLTKEDFLRTPESALDGLWSLVRRVYTTLPGATTTETHYDATTNTDITVSKTRKLKSDITPGAVIVGSGTGATVVVTTEEPIDNLTAFEVVTVQPLPANHGYTTALETKQDFVPFEFPATLDVDLYVSSTGALGYNPAFVRRVSQITKTWWEISATKPDISSIMNDATLGGLTVLASIWGLTAKGVGTIPEIIMDAKTITYPGGVGIAWPGSIPDLTTYLSAWVGTTSSPTGARAWRGEVNPDGNFFRWRVDITFVQYLVPPQGTIVP